MFKEVIEFLLGIKRYRERKVAGLDAEMKQNCIFNRLAVCLLTGKVGAVLNFDSSPTLPRSCLRGSPKQLLAMPRSRAVPPGVVQSPCIPFLLCLTAGAPQPSPAKFALPAPSPFLCSC